MPMAGTGVMTNSPRHLWSLHYALDHEVISLQFCGLVVTAKHLKVISCNTKSELPLVELKYCHLSWSTLI